MQTVRNLLQKGNGKLGENIHHWSIPAWQTCPGRSAACRVCYAMSGHYHMPNVKANLARNYDVSLKDGFVRRIVREIDRRWCQVVRIHVAGDFYDPAYTRKWLEIVQRCPDVIFYAYTRSWRVPEIAPVLVEIANHNNVKLWYSADDDTGIPQDVPKTVRVAWLMETEGQHEMIELSDLVFRAQPLRKTPSRRIGLTLVCPVENGSGKDTDCGRCGVCWT